MEILKNGPTYVLVLVGMFNLEQFVVAAAFFVARISARTVAAKVESAEHPPPSFEFSGGGRIQEIPSWLRAFWR